MVDSTKGEGTVRNANLTRCQWAEADPLLATYHDAEWGVPLRDDRRLFEFLALDGFQAGLSWRIVLRKREAFRRAFADFDLETVANFGPGDVERLAGDKSIVRNRAKIQATVENARAVLAIQKEMGSFSDYLWGFTGGRTIQNAWRTWEEVPPTSPESEAMSKDLKARGFKFVGPTICHAFMQSAGMVNDHLVDCFRYGAAG
ncbi:MAG: DNA-3-methyladenine glycosylase I [Desulfococcaceae bacterium]